MDTEKLILELTTLLDGKLDDLIELLKSIEKEEKDG